MLSLSNPDNLQTAADSSSSSSLEPSPKKEFKLFTPYNLDHGSNPAPNDSCGSTRQDTSGSSEAASSEFDFDKNGSDDGLLFDEEEDDDEIEDDDDEINIEEE